VVDPSGQPEASVPVLVHDFEGRLLVTDATDGDGELRLTPPDPLAYYDFAFGWYVTAAFGTPTSPRLVTVSGVLKGQEVTLMEVPPPPSTSPQMTSILALPSHTGAPGATTYVASAGACSTTFSAPPASLTLYDGPYPPCLAGESFPLLVRALDDTGAAVAFAFKGANAVSGAVSLADAGWLEPGTMTIGATNLPNVVYGGTSSAAFVESARGVPFAFARPFPRTGGEASPLAFDSHPGFADFAQAEVRYELPMERGPGLARSSIATRFENVASSMTASFDVAQLLPVITEATANARFTDPPGNGVNVYWGNTQKVFRRKFVHPIPSVLQGAA
jgi:hypothetical protein